MSRFLFYSAVSILFIVTVVFYFNINVASFSPVRDIGGEPKCEGWTDSCLVTASAASSTFNSPGGEKDAKTDALAKCEARKGTVGVSNGCIERFNSLCEPPCQLYWKETENTLDQPCKIFYCTEVIAPSGSTEDDLKTDCTYTYDEKGAVKTKSCFKVHPRDRAGYPVGWTCTADDGKIGWDVTCGLLV